MGKKRIKPKKVNFIVLCVLLCLAVCHSLMSDGRNRQEDKTVLTIAVVQDTRISNLETNYYKKWLEEQTGFSIQFEYILEGYEKEYLSTMLTTEHNTVDAVFLPEKQELLTEEEFQGFVREGLITDLAAFDTKESNLAGMIEKYGTGQPEVYYFPNIDTSRKSQNMQVFWINIGWLKALNLQVPRTADELLAVLRAFKECDPNENGMRDELPLISCEAEDTLRSYYYLLNTFTCYNPFYGGIYQDKQGNVIYAPITDEFRDGLKYAAMLYEEEYLSGVCFDYSGRQLMELVNDPDNLVGAFTSQSIADVVYPNCADILARFIQVAPLLSEEGTGNAVKVDYRWEIGGYIPANSRHPEEAFALMDLMLSKEASLIAEFGEEGADWKFSEQGDLSTYETKAKITTLHYLHDCIQNKNFAGAGPHVLDAEYANGVTWNGNNSLVEYIDARAVKSYELYYGDTSSGEDIAFDTEALKKLREYTDDRLRLFVTGELSAEEDSVWDAFCREYRELAEKAVREKE